MYKANILKDSINSFGKRITTFEVSFPRIILAETNTHRVFSRNYSSSRAIPVYKFIDILENDPFVPVYWGANQTGMGASKEIPAEDHEEAKAIWLSAMKAAISHANSLLALGVAKEITNRLLEPWMWVTGIITSTEFNNFFNLRRHSTAQPEIRYLANLMYEEYKSSCPNQLKPSEWHLPMINPAEESLYSHVFQLAISTGRLARVSYLTHDGKRDPQKDIELHDRLLISKHLSPFEHCAKNQDDNRWYGNLRGWKQYRKFIPNESGDGDLPLVTNKKET
jgi:thymidylate synthase ThyX